MTGILISGKISVGVRRSTTGVSSTITRAMTMNVYGLASANRTIHIERADDLWARGAGRTAQNSAWIGYQVYVVVLDSERGAFGYVGQVSDGEGSPGTCKANLSSAHNLLKFLASVNVLQMTTNIIDSPSTQCPPFRDFREGKLATVPACSGPGLVHNIERGFGGATKAAETGQGNHLADAFLPGLRAQT